MKGYDDKTFLPDNNITRAEFAAVFSKFIYEVTDKSEVNYNDLDFNDWFYTPGVKNDKLRIHERIRRRNI